MAKKRLPRKVKRLLDAAKDARRFIVNGGELDAWAGMIDELYDAIKAFDPKWNPRV